MKTADSAARSLPELFCSVSWLNGCTADRPRKGVPRILIVSNKKCTHAVHLNRKFGFREIPVDKKQFPFERADIAFQMDLAAAGDQEPQKNE
jgi:hypothetical protein